MGENFSNKLRFGPFEADLHTRELWKHGVRIKLVGQPFEVLSELLSKPGQLVTREELRARLWPGDTFVDFNHGLNAAVNKLREALCDSAEDPRYIETLPRRGYRFIATVEGGVAKDKAHKADDGLSEGTTLPQLDAGPSIASEQAAAVATCESSALSQPSSLSQASTPLETEREPGPRPRWLKLLCRSWQSSVGLCCPGQHSCTLGLCGKHLRWPVDRQNRLSRSRISQTQQAIQLSRRMENEWRFAGKATPPERQESS